MKRFRIELGNYDIVQRAGQGDSSQLVLRRLRARLWCPYCPGDGFTHCASWEWAWMVVKRHLTLHDDEIRIQLASDRQIDRVIGSPPIVSMLAMLPDEDEGQQFRHTLTTPALGL